MVNKFVWHRHDNSWTNHNESYNVSCEKKSIETLKGDLFGVYAIFTETNTNRTENEKTRNKERENISSVKIKKMSSAYCGFVPSCPDVKLLVADALVGNKPIRTITRYWKYKQTHKGNDIGELIQNTSRCRSKFKTLVFLKLLP